MLQLRRKKFPVSSILDNMKKVIIASKNPVKINATKIGFEKMFPNDNFEFEGISVSSNVSDQPTDEKETMLGASNRANNASVAVPDADYWIGIEGGIEKSNEEMCTFTWIVIKSNGTDIVGKARTGTFFLPPKIVELIDSGKELGDAGNIVFGQTNLKQKGGAVGLLTDDVVDRTKFYSEAVVLALIPFKNPKFY